MLPLLFWDKTHFLGDRMSVPYIRLRTDTATTAAASGLVHKADTHRHTFQHSRTRAANQVAVTLLHRVQPTLAKQVEREREFAIESSMTHQRRSIHCVASQHTFLLAMPSTDICGACASLLGLPPSSIFTAPANGNGNGSSEGKGRKKFTVPRHTHTQQTAPSL